MNETKTADLQLIWDTCLLKHWRISGTVFAAINDFEQQTGKRISECDLLRLPPLGYPWLTGMRVFMAAYLYKIGDRMWDLPPERDAALIQKLQTSKYNTSNQNVRQDSDLSREIKRTKANQAKMALESKNYKNRNKKTDWGTTK